MNKSTTFYQHVLGLEPQIKSPRLTMFPLSNTTLILFKLGQTASDSIGERGVIPGHGPDEQTVRALTTSDADGNSEATLHTHYCLAVATRIEVDTWEEYLKSKDVILRGTMNWEKGGRSVYFEDPDGHIGEIGSRGIWVHY